MKIKKLNEQLVAGQSVPVLFLYPPVALPIDKQGQLVTESSASDIYYSTFVYSLQDDNFYILEFGNNILDGLLGYRARHKTISNVEILLSREANGDLRMTTGGPNVKPGRVSKSRYEEYLAYHDKLFDRYMSKLGQQLHEYIQK